MYIVLFFNRNGEKIHNGFNYTTGGGEWKGFITLQDMYICFWLPIEIYLVKQN